MPCSVSTLFMLNPITLCETLTNGGTSATRHNTSKNKRYNTFGLEKPKSYYYAMYCERIPRKAM